MTEAYEFGAEIERLLGAIAERPSDLALHRRLRRTSLRYKAAGGPPLGRLAWLLRARERDPIRRLIHAERAWSHDAGNTDRLLNIGRAVESCVPARRELDFSPMRGWIAELLRAAAADGPR